MQDSILPYNDEFFMREAIKEAQKAYEAGEVPVGCVIVCNNMVIARAHNYTERLNDVTAHAEIQAITAAASHIGGKYLKDCTIYITLEPCMMCAGALGWSQVDRIVYGASDPKKGVFSKYAVEVLHPKTQISSGYLADTCTQLLTRFFQDKRK